MYTPNDDYPKHSNYDPPRSLGIAVAIGVVGFIALVAWVAYWWATA